MSKWTRCRRGSAWIIAIILLSMCAAMAVSFAAATNQNARLGANTADIQRANLAADSGLGFAVRQCKKLRLPAATTVDTAMAAIAADLAGRLNGTANLAGAAISSTADTVTIPAIATGRESFEVQFKKIGTKLYVEVWGTAGVVRRGRRMEVALTSPTNSVFDYGLASRGQISISGNGEIHGMNELTEASVISTVSSGVAISLGGNAVIDGDLSSVGAGTSVVISGTPTVAGSTNPLVIARHIHFGVAEPVFPVIDTSIFRALATNVVDSSTDVSQKGATYENLIIRAGTNPTFASDIVVNGVVYVEAPNIVSFSGKVTLNGLVATDPAGANPLTSCKVNFAGQVEAFGVEALPDLPQFQAVKQLTGTFVAAPGFDVSFAGQFTTINGTIAADKLTFSGQAFGTVRGSVIGMAEQNTSVSGTVNIIIDRAGLRRDPPGFSTPLVLTPDPKSYVEVGS